jgi:glutathione synthase/RimK-type ligase-like ATP-grasp enzyme
VRRGARPLRLDTDRFPSGGVRLSARLGPPSVRHLVDGAELRGEDVRAVWLRRLWAPGLDPELEPSFREASERESRAALEGFLSGLEGARFLDPLVATRAAGDKLRQLRWAREAGLRIPRTLVTNDPAEARAFFTEVEGRMVAKLLTSLSTRMDGAGPFLPTSVVEEADLAGLESLRLCPMVFQERMEKATELRVVHVAGRLFTGAIGACGSRAGAVDWRCARAGEASWQPGELPAPTAARFCALMKRLGLSFGAADFIVPPEGEPVFLEVNPGGEWGMLERDLGLPISEAIAETLLGA